MGGLTTEHETDNGSDEEEPCTEGEPDHRRADLGVRHGCSRDVEEANQGRGGDADQEKPNEAEGPCLGVEEHRCNAPEDECGSADSGHDGDPAVDQSALEEVDEGDRTSSSHNPRGCAGDEDGDATEDDADRSHRGPLPAIGRVEFSQCAARAWTARSMASRPAMIAERPTSSSVA